MGERKKEESSKVLNKAYLEEEEGEREGGEGEDKEEQENFQPFQT